MFRFRGLQDNRCTFSVYRHAGDASIKFDPRVQCKAFKVEQTHKKVYLWHKALFCQNASLCYLHSSPNLMESGTLLMRVAG